MLHRSWGGCAGRGATRGPLTRFLRLDPDAEPFLAVEAVDPLVVDPPALPPQQDVQPPVAVPHPRRGQVPQPHPQRRLVLRLTLR